MIWVQVGMSLSMSQANPMVNKGETAKSALTFVIGKRCKASIQNIFEITKTPAPVKNNHQAWWVISDQAGVASIQVAKAYKKGSAIKLRTIKMVSLGTKVRAFF